MSLTLQVASKAADQDRVAIGAASNVVEDVLGHVRELARSSDHMRAQGNNIRHDVEGLLIALQFQDRIRQILEVVEADMARLGRTVGEEKDETLPTLESWLKELEQHYTMDDERHAHQSTGGAASASGASEDVTFF